MERAQTPEGRRFPRIETPAGVWVSWGTGATTSVSRVSDLNEGGMFISTPVAPFVGTSIKVLLVAPEGEIRAQAIVRNVASGRGMGIEFTALGAEDKACLKKVMARLLAAQNK
jgi:hypothetical protein